MTSTNHFRKRRLVGNQRALIKAPCVCPPVIAPPDLFGVYYSIALQMLTGLGNIATLQQTSVPLTRINDDEWHLDFNAIEGWPSRIIFNWDPGVLNVQHTIDVDDGAGLSSYAFDDFGVDDLPTPAIETNLVPTMVGGAGLNWGTYGFYLPQPWQPM